MNEYVRKISEGATIVRDAAEALQSLLAEYDAKAAEVVRMKAQLAKVTNELLEAAQARNAALAQEADINARLTALRARFGEAK